MFITHPAPVVARRLPRLMLGLSLFGVGLAFMVESNLGLPPWDVLHQGISNRTPLTIGLAGILVSFLVLFLWIPLREKLGIGTLANAVVIGLVVDLTIWLLPTFDNLAAQIAAMLGGIVTVGIGSGYYIGARLGTGPRDGLMTGIARRGPSIRLTRTVIEFTVLALGWLLGGTVGIGTVAFMLFIGPVVQFFLPRLDMGDPPIEIETTPAPEHTGR